MNLSSDLSAQFIEMQQALANEINNSLKNGTWFSNYYCRAFEHLSTMLASILQWVRSIDVLCLSFVQSIFEIFLQMKIHLDIFWLKYCCKSNLWRDISFGYHAHWCCSRYFPRLYPDDLSAAETRTWCLSLFSSSRALTASEMLRSRSLLAKAETKHRVFWKYVWNIVARKSNLNAKKFFPAQLNTCWHCSSSLCQC